MNATEQQQQTEQELRDDYEMKCQLVVERYSLALERLEEEKRKIAEEVGFTVEQVQLLCNAREPVPLYVPKRRNPWNAFVSDQWRTVPEDATNPAAAETDECIPRQAQVQTNAAQMKRLGAVYRHMSDEERRLYAQKAQEHNTHRGLQSFRGGELGNERATLAGKLLNGIKDQLHVLQNVAGMESFVVLGRSYGSVGVLKNETRVLGTEMGTSFWQYCEANFAGMEFELLQTKFNAYCVSHCPGSEIARFLAPAYADGGAGRSGTSEEQELPRTKAIRKRRRGPCKQEAHDVQEKVLALLQAVLPGAMSVPWTKLRDDSHPLVRLENWPLETVRGPFGKDPMSASDRSKVLLSLENGSLRFVEKRGVE